MIPLLEREIEYRKSGSTFPHSLWLAAKDIAKEPDGGNGTTEQYRAGLRAIAEASGKHEIGEEHVAAALAEARRVA
jgi:hypothetical protein